MWYAITGHGPDASKVLPMEFKLLSIIASHKGNGIIQTELVNASGQDKRSVPKRTDQLSRKGYIEKRPIQAKSVRTSLCTLRKFVGTPSYLDGSFKTPADRGKGLKPEAGDVIDFKVFLDNLFKCLKEYKIITRNDLKDRLGMADSWRWKVLSRALRKLETMGFVKRLRAASRYSTKTYHPSVMLVKEPTEQDLGLFYENSRNLLTFTENEETTGPDLEDGDEKEPRARSKLSPPAKAVTGVSRLEGMGESGRIIPRWTPGRSLPNLMFDVIDKAGPRGMTNNVNISSPGDPEHANRFVLGYKSCLLWKLLSSFHGGLVESYGGMLAVLAATTSPAPCFDSRHCTPRNNNPLCPLFIPQF